MLKALGIELLVRKPPPLVRRVLSLFDLADLIEPEPVFA